MSVTVEELRALEPGSTVVVTMLDGDPVDPMFRRKFKGRVWGVEAMAPEHLLDQPAAWCLELLPVMTDDGMPQYRSFRGDLIESVEVV